MLFLALVCMSVILANAQPTQTYTAANRIFNDYFRKAQDIYSTKASLQSFELSNVYFDSDTIYLKTYTCLQK